MTDLRETIARLRALAEVSGKASPHPWRESAGNSIPTARDACGHYVFAATFYEGESVDARLIIDLRNALPALLDAAEAGLAAQEAQKALASRNVVLEEAIREALDCATSGDVFRTLRAALAATEGDAS